MRKLFYSKVVGLMDRLHVYEERTDKYLSYFVRARRLELKAYEEKLLNGPINWLKLANQIAYPSLERFLDTVFWEKLGKTLEELKKSCMCRKQLSGLGDVHLGNWV